MWICNLKIKKGCLIFTSKLNINTFCYQGFLCKKCSQIFFGNIRNVLLYCNCADLIPIAVLVFFTVLKKRSGDGLTAKTCWLFYPVIYCEYGWFWENTFAISVEKILEVCKISKLQLHEIRGLKYDWTEGRQEVCRLEEELDKDAVCHQFYSTCTANASPRNFCMGLETSTSEGKLFKLWNMQMTLC